jgi:hypothetical protein
MTKRKRVLETKKKEDKKVQVKKAENRFDDENPSRMEFGGMPERSLKKNLGCG